MFSNENQDNRRGGLKRRIAIFDIDGTLSDSTHRNHFVQTAPKDWTSFFAAQPLDPLREDVAEVLRMYRQQDDVAIVLLTGRGEEHREVTEAWLEKHGIIYEALVMRSLGDRTNDDVIKMEYIKKWQQEGYEVVGFFDDRKRICDAARAHGITVFQMAAGEF